MISNRAGKDPVPTSQNRPASSVSPLLQRLRNLLQRLTEQPSRHLRSLAGLLRRRRTLATALLAGSATAATILTVATANHFQTPDAPLAAPRPVPTAAQALASAPKIKVKRHRIADAFHSSYAELQRLSDLHPLRGIATWYGSVLHGHKTASGETFDETAMTAAHRTLPLGTVVRVTDLRTLRSVIVRINDRGVLAPGRIIDLSSAAAIKLGILHAGTAQVKLEVLNQPNARTVSPS